MPVRLRADKAREVEQKRFVSRSLRVIQLGASKVSDPRTYYLRFTVRLIEALEKGARVLYDSPHSQRQYCDEAVIQVLDEIADFARIPEEVSHLIRLILREVEPITFGYLTQRYECAASACPEKALGVASLQDEVDIDLPARAKKS